MLLTPNYDPNAVHEEVDPDSVHTDQSSPQSITGLGNGLIKLTGNVLGVDTNTYPSTNIPTTPNVDDILKWNGTAWVNASGSVASVGTGVTFYLSDDEILPELETLQKNPDTNSETSETGVVKSSTSPIMIDQYLYNTALGLSSLSGGIWTFNTYCSCNTTDDTNEIVTSVSKVVAGTGTINISDSGTTRTVVATGATPFVAGDYNADKILCGRLITPVGIFKIKSFVSTSEITIETDSGYAGESNVTLYSIERYLFDVTTGDINEPSASLKSVVSVRPVYTIAATDKLLVRYWAKSDHSTDVDILLWHSGTTHYTHIVTPIATRHNELPGLDGGTSNQYYHLTQTEYNGNLGNKNIQTTGDITGADLTGSSITIGSDTLNGIADLKVIEELSGTTGLLKKTAANTWQLDNTTYLVTETDPVVAAIEGIVKSESGVIKAAISGTDYLKTSDQVTHNSTTGYEADRHLAHSDISINPGAGMSGGGNLSSSRTLTCTITQYTDADALEATANAYLPIAGKAADSDKLDGMDSTAFQVAGNYQASDATLTALAALNSDAGLLKQTAEDTFTKVTDNSTNWNTAYTDRLKWDGGATDLNASNARTNLGLVIGTNVQAQNIALSDISGLTKTNGNFIVANGTNWTAQSPTTVKSTLGLSTSDNVTFNTINAKRVFNSIAVDTLLTEAHEVVSVTVSGKTITLPTAASKAGRCYYIDNASTGNITVQAHGSETINGENTQVVAPDCCMEVISNDTNWRII